MKHEFLVLNKSEGKLQVIKERKRCHCCGARGSSSTHLQLVEGMWPTFTRKLNMRPNNMRMTHGESSSIVQNYGVACRIDVSDNKPALVTYRDFNSYIGKKRGHEGCPIGKDALAILEEIDEMDSDIWSKALSSYRIYYWNDHKHCQDRLLDVANFSMVFETL